MFRAFGEPSSHFSVHPGESRDPEPHERSVFLAPGPPAFAGVSETREVIVYPPVCDNASGKNMSRQSAGGDFRVPVFAMKLTNALMPPTLVV